MGQESRSRRKRAQQRQDLGGTARSGPAAATEASVRDAAPASLIAKYGAVPLHDLPGPVEKFHLRVVTDILSGFERCARPDAIPRATQIWHKHHDGLAASRPGALNFGGTVKQLACAPGCNHCCRSPVGVVAAEVMLVAQSIDRTLSAADRAGLDQRMQARKAALHGSDELALYLCPLNTDGKCLVYESRPYNCRVFHSFDVAACEQLFVAGETGRSLPIDPVRKHYDPLIASSATVALRALNLDMRMIEFMPALEIALAAGAQRAERFAAGEDLFSSLPTIAPPSTPGDRSRQPA